MKTEQMQDAFRLFLQTSLTKTEIADYLNISRRTVNYWATDNQWDRIKTCAGNLPMIMAENCYLIMGKLQNEILSDTNTDKPINLKQINSLCKLTNTVRKIATRNTLNDNIELRGLFLDHVNAQNPELALQIQPYIDSYLLTQVKASSKEYKDLQSAWAANPQSNQSNTEPDDQPLTRLLIDREEARLDQEDLLYWAQNPPTEEEIGYTPENKPTNKKVAWANPDEAMKSKMEMLKTQGLSRAQRRKIIRSKAAA